jgi:hypothetical protein
MWLIDKWFIAVQVFLVVTIAVFIILEIFLSLNDIKGDTISYIIRAWAYSRNFFIMLAWGIVTGHLFLGAKEPWLRDNTLSVIVVALFVCIAALVGCKLKSVKLNKTIQLILFIVGVFIGHFMWSMNDVLIP